MNNRIGGFLVLVLLTGAGPAFGADFKFATQTLTVPDGFEVEVAAGTDLVPRPVSGSFDELGRLYVTDSSGSNAKPDQQLTNRTHRVLRLEDSDGDGKFDKVVVVADQMMFPEGCLWYDGSVYVAAPPSIWKLTDTNGDGVADTRVEWHEGKTLTGCANDLHGPYLGPDGWIYWCKGAFAEQSYEVNGKPFKSRAAHIFRARPDHSGLEPVMTGGMDNPVGLAFTPEGERILCGTFFAPQEPGHRDGLIHAVYGGVYGKPNDVLDGHPRTGELMPVMTHMGAAAPCAVIRYQAAGWGDEYRDNLFCCQFNLHKVSRHILEPDGATFKTKDSDFLVSNNPDFHPTDVIEDADGSLLVLDTGAWYKLCCPTSQLAKPDVLGTIYRIRRKGAPKVNDPRGLKLAWGKLNEKKLTELLGDERGAVRNRAVLDLGKRGDPAVPLLREIASSGKAGPFELPHPEDKAGYLRQYHEWRAAQIAKLPHPRRVRELALWTLARIRSESALEAIRLGIDDYEEGVRLVALDLISLTRDEPGGRLVLPAAQEMMGHREWRAWFEVAGRTGVLAANKGLEIYANFKDGAIDLPQDRVLFHSLTYALIEAHADAAARFLASDSMGLCAASLIARDQMVPPTITAGEISGYLRAGTEAVRKAAAWVAGRHPEWGNELAGYFRERLAQEKLGEAAAAELENQLAQFVTSEAMQQVLAEQLLGAVAPARKELLLHVMARPGLNAVPSKWPEAVRQMLGEKDHALAGAAVAVARSLGEMKSGAPDFSEALQAMARDAARPAELRVEALAALRGAAQSLDAGTFAFLSDNLDPAKSVVLRNGAAGVLVKARLSETQLGEVADRIKACGPMEASRLLTAFEHSTNEALGLRLLAALKESKGLTGVRPDALQALAARYPAPVQQAAAGLLALLNVDAGKQKAHLDELMAALPAGDIRRGQLVFNSTKTACATCHRMGYLGGKVGPDLTSIGPARTERDLLESIVYPSASFVRSYEPYVVVTKQDEEFSGVLRSETANEIVLATGPTTEARVARADIAELRPGRVSVMPAGLEEQLSKQELSDLVAFLKNTKWGPQ